MRTIRATLRQLGHNWSEEEIQKLARRIDAGEYDDLPEAQTLRKPGDSVTFTAKVDPAFLSESDKVRREIREQDQRWMREAIKVARRHEEMGDRPFGCVIVDERNQLLAYAGGSEYGHEPTWHSEMEAIRRACARRGGTLEGCTIYSTHEPCPMCAGAINHAKLSMVVWGTDRVDLPLLFRKLSVNTWDRLRDTSKPPLIRSGVMRAECLKLFDLENTAAAIEQAAQVAAAKPVTGGLIQDDVLDGPGIESFGT